MKLRLAALFALLAVALAACNFSLAEDITPPPGYVAPTPAPTLPPAFPASAPNVNSGAAIFAEKCAPCHGLSGQGDGPQAANLPLKVPALGAADLASAASPAQWYAIVTQGRMDKLMPPFNSLSDEQRWDVVSYALSLSAPTEQIQAGKALYETNCTQCHGADGKLSSNADLGSQAGMAKLSRNDIASVIQKGKQPGMPALALADQDALNIAAYMRTFTFAASQAVVTAPTAAPKPPSSSSDITPIPEGTASTGADTVLTPGQPVGKIGGTVINGSGGSVPGGLKAVLHTFEHDLATKQFTEGKLLETDVDANGNYVFSDVPMPATSAYYVSVEFSGATYESSPAIPGQDNKTEYELPITIYETTTYTAELSISTAHILLDYSQPGKIQVVEFYIISNPGKKSVVAAEKGGTVLKISLPKGYQNLQFENGSLGGRYVQTTDGFGDTVAIPPTSAQSQYSLVFAFDMAYTEDKSPLAFLGGDKFELSQQFPLKAEAVNLLVPVGVKAEGANLAAGKTQEMGSGVTFQLYSTGAIEAGQTFTAKMSGSPQATATTPATSANSTQNIIIGVGAFGVVLILAGAFLFWRDRRKTAEDEALEEANEVDDDEEEAGQVDEDEIIDAIIALDDQFKAGNLSEEAYKQRREQLKAKLRNS